MRILVTILLGLSWLNGSCSPRPKLPEPSSKEDGEVKGVVEQDSSKAKEKESEDQSIVFSEEDEPDLKVGEESVTQACQEGSQRTQICGVNGNGSQFSECENGVWGEFSECDDEDTCLNDAEQEVSCGLNNRGTKMLVCLEGTFVDKEECQDPDVCQDGATAQESCGFLNRGTRTNTCVNGQFEAGNDCDY